MPQILLNVSGVQKELWVAAAHDERVSLSEWIRRRCDAGLGAADGGAVTTRPLPEGIHPGAALVPPSVAPSPVLPTSVREFRPDPKKKP